jgi:predicted S18 family serine protease
MEADERYKYASMFFPTYMQDSTKSLDAANEDMNKGNYALCIFKASKAKAEADLILSSMGVSLDNFDEVLQQKIDSAKIVISEQSKKDIFPILGYSYYNYALSLKKDDPYSAVIYAEYAIELSNLDMYFPPERKRSFTITESNVPFVLLFMAGLIIGFAISELIHIFRIRNQVSISIKKKRK